MTDVITVSRVPIAVVMLLGRRHRNVVVGAFVLGVTTDLVDGAVARRLGTASPRGARLDSVADAVFVSASSIVAARTLDAAARPPTGTAAGLVAATRFVTLLVTRRRFGVWSVAHTYLNKATGAALAMVVAVALVRGRMPIRALGMVAGLAELAALEELAIALREADDDPDRSHVHLVSHTR